jgi:hypothetical protein
MEGAILGRMARHAYVLLALCLAFSIRAQAQTAAPPTPQPKPGQPPASGSPPPRPRAAADTDRPPPEYYVEPPQAGAPRPPPNAPRPAPPGGIYEPPPPGYGYGPQLVAPKYSLWLGPRIGWFIPFGNLIYQCNGDGRGGCGSYTGAAWSDYAASGPMFELDAGARLGRFYNLFALWEHAALHGGDGNPAETAGGGLDHANTDYFGLGFRVSSDADKVGFLTEIDLGLRRFHAVYSNGSELQFSEEVPLEARIGFGADIRITPQFSLSPMLSLGVGRFDKATHVAPDGKETDVLGSLDELANHGWLTLQMGAHFDLAGGG